MLKQWHNILSKTANATKLRFAFKTESHAGNTRILCFNKTFGRLGHRAIRNHPDFSVTSRNINTYLMVASSVTTLYCVNQMNSFFINIMNVNHDFYVGSWQALCQSIKFRQFIKVWMGNEAYEFQLKPNSF